VEVEVHNTGILETVDMETAAAVEDTVVLEMVVLEQFKQQLQV
jgi:hypothetical protein